MISFRFDRRHQIRRSADRVRSAVEMAVVPHTALQNMCRRFGPICTLAAGPLRYVYLLGPAGNRFIFSHSELFNWREAFDALVAIDGETALIVSDGAQHQRRRRLVMHAFGRRQIEGYAQTMRVHADEAIDSWHPGQVVDLYAELRRVIRRSTIEVLFGPRLAADEPELGRLLQRTIAVLDRLPPWQQLQRLGTPVWRRALAARATVAQRIRAEIHYRRSHPDDAQEEGGRDVLTRLMGSRDEDGGGLSEVEIVDQVISLIAAGYEETSAAMAWVIHAVLADPQVAQRAKADAAEPGAASRDWRYLDGVVSEALRLYPPVVMSARKVVEPFDFAGTTVRAGSIVIFSPFVTHRLAELWPQPERFDPGRWDPRQPGYRRPPPEEYLPFGGGTHRCLGGTFAHTQLTVLLEQLLTRTSLQLESVDARPVGLIAMRPRKGPFARVLARPTP